MKVKELWKIWDFPPLSYLIYVNCRPIVAKKNKTSKPLAWHQQKDENVYFQGIHRL